MPYSTLILIQEHPCYSCVKVKPCIFYSSDLLEKYCCPFALLQLQVPLLKHDFIILFWNKILFFLRSVPSSSKLLPALCNMFKIRTPLSFFFYSTCRFLALPGLFNFLFVVIFHKYRKSLDSPVLLSKPSLSPDSQAFWLLPMKFSPGPSSVAILLLNSTIFILFLNASVLKALLN